MKFFYINLQLHLVDRSLLKGSVLNGLSEILSDLENGSSLRGLLSNIWFAEEKKEHLKNNFLTGYFKTDANCTIINESKILS